MNNVEFHTQKKSFQIEMVCIFYFLIYLLSHECNFHVEAVQRCIRFMVPSGDVCCESLWCGVFGYSFSRLF